MHSDVRECPNDVARMCNHKLLLYYYKIKHGGNSLDTDEQHEHQFRLAPTIKTHVFKPIERKNKRSPILSIVL